VLDGRSEIGTVLASYLTDVLLEMGPLELPFMTSNMAECKKAAFQPRPFYAEMLARKGLKLLSIHTWPSQQIFSTAPIRTVADWKGKKIRVYGADSANIARILGAAPVNIAFGEVYSALEKKTVDGAMTSATNAEPMKFFEVAKFLDYWFIAGAAQEWLVKRLPELGMTVVDPPREEIEKARQAARAAWDTWLSRTGADGKRGLELALQALGR
jgi:TRAP-type C4-dicarboxylate transport system substrate-binding protein